MTRFPPRAWEKIRSFLPVTNWNAHCLSPVKPAKKPATSDDHPSKHF
jgi:hypothetical protein